MEGLRFAIRQEHVIVNDPSATSALYSVLTADVVQGRWDRPVNRGKCVYNLYIHLYVLSQWLVVLKKGVHMCCPLYVQCFHSYLISSEYIHCCERYCMLLHQMAVPWRPSIPTPSVHTYRFGKLLRLFCKHWTTCHTAYASSRLAVAAHSFQTTSL